MEHQTGSVSYGACGGSVFRNSRVGDRDLRHQFLTDDVQHFFQLCTVLRGKPLCNALHDHAPLSGADVIVIDILLGHFQMECPPVCLGLNTVDVALFREAVDLISGVGGRDAHEGGKFIDRGSAQGQDGLHAEGLYRGEACLPGLEALEDLFVKMQLKLGIYVKKSIF